jgi:hypothetical protein
MSAPKTKTKYVSKGERPSVSSDVCKVVKRDRTLITKLQMKQKAWLKGQNPWLSVPNPNTADTKQKFVRVRANSEWGDPRRFVNILGNAATSN